MNNIIIYLIANQFITSLLILPIVILVNIFLGWAIADFAGSFDRARFILGFKKGLAVYVAIVTLSLVSHILIIADLDLTTTIALIVYTVLITYILQVLEKIRLIMGYKGPETKVE